MYVFSLLSPILRALSTWLTWKDFHKLLLALFNIKTYSCWSIKFRSSNKTCSIRCFSFNLCGFYIESSLVTRLVMITKHLYIFIFLTWSPTLNLGSLSLCPTLAGYIFIVLGHVCCICQVFHLTYQYTSFLILQPYACRFWSSGPYWFFFDKRISFAIFWIHFHSKVFDLLWKSLLWPTHMLFSLPPDSSKSFWNALVTVMSFFQRIFAVNINSTQK